MKDTYFTKEALDILEVTREDAIRMNRGEISSAHLLMAIMKTENPGKIAILKCALQNVSTLTKPELFEEMLFMTVEPDSGFLDVIPGKDPGFSARMKVIFEMAMDEAIDMGLSQIDSTHLVMGLIREGGSVAARTLNLEFGVEYSRVKLEVFRLVDLDLKNFRYVFNKEAYLKWGMGHLSAAQFLFDEAKDDFFVKETEQIISRVLDKIEHKAVMPESREEYLRVKPNDLYDFIKTVVTRGAISVGIGGYTEIPGFYFRSGCGFSIAHLEPKRPLILGGMELISRKGQEEGHPDVLVKAMGKALSSAGGVDFEPKNAQHLREIADEIDSIGYKISSINIKLIIDEGILESSIDPVLHHLASILRVGSGILDLEIPDSRGMGFSGFGRGVACLCRADLEPV
ncbi:MAG: 2-C-methyl-D-erythritol 2,4-cyclodiphosphate synthase [Candidatus Eremiobacteraeota bacterium]|nr:2-C-methyl-D-erythritol 2,4-cyclodiphosphate synthase [Candidatus Eremiobacteraeota bacterium]